MPLRGRFTVSVKPTLRMCICSRTATARIRQDADDEHKKQHPNLRRPINLCVFSFEYASVQAYDRMDYVLTRVHSFHFEVMPYSPETSGARPCEASVNGSMTIMRGEVKVSTGTPLGHL